jgi:hypothetical protein
MSAKLVPTFADKCCVVSTTDPHGCILGFLDQSRYYFLRVVPHLYLRDWVDPPQTHYSSENLVAPGIETGPLDLLPETLTTRPQRRSSCFQLSINIKLPMQKTYPSICLPPAALYGLGESTWMSSSRSYSSRFQLHTFIEINTMFQF